jgi:hypothetical protein
VVIFVLNRLISDSSVFKADYISSFRFSDIVVAVQHVVNAEFKGYSKNYDCFFVS